MFLVVSYDIADDRRRTRVAKLLRNYGQRVQYSVFECLLTDRQVRELRRRLHKLVRVEADSVRFYFLPQDAVAQIAIVGLGQVTREREVHIV